MELTYIDIGFKRVLQFDVYGYTRFQHYYFDIKQDIELTIDSFNKWNVDLTLETVDFYLLITDSTVNERRQRFIQLKIDMLRLDIKTTVYRDPSSIITLNPLTTDRLYWIRQTMSPILQLDIDYKFTNTTLLIDHKSTILDEPKIVAFSGA